jgi:hypothetical protein
MLIQEHKKEIFLFFNHIDLDKFTCCCINWICTMFLHWNELKRIIIDFKVKKLV